MFKYNTALKFKKFHLIVIFSGFLLGGCGSPYLEKGYKSENDYDFAVGVSKKSRITPVGVERFKNIGISSVTQFNEALNQMHTSGYSKSNDIDDVLEFARDRFEGAKTGISAADHKKVRLAEASRIKAEKEEAERREAQRLANEAAAKKRQEELAENARRQEYARKEAEAKKALLAKKEHLRRSNIYETDVISLIVDFKAYKGRRVYLKCWINLFSSYGGNCWSSNDTQSVAIDHVGMDKDLYKWLLLRCPNRFYNENNYKCRGMGVIATVGGSSVPRLENVVYYELD